MEILQILKTYQRSTMNLLSHTYDITRKESSIPRTTVTTYTRKYLSHLELLRFQETNSKEVPSFITVGRRAYWDPSQNMSRCISFACFLSLDHYSNHDIVAEPLRVDPDVDVSSLLCFECYLQGGRNVPKRAIQVRTESDKGHKKVLLV
mmetsp:Transcript_14073/g.34080  ORF Transcript_14073/g.34080 Transcript_14073/m.34080 type:complete len:149 (+) Transcript_14073:1601-2047(+)